MTTTTLMRRHDGAIVVKVHYAKVDMTDMNHANREASRLAFEKVDKVEGFKAWFTETRFTGNWFETTFTPMTEG